MKLKLIIIGSFLININFMSGQAVVNDPVVSANIIKQTIQDAVAMGKEAEEFERLRKRVLALKKVTNAIKKGKLCLSIVKNLNYAKNKVSSIKDNLSKLRNIKQREDMLFQIDLLLDQVLVYGDLYSDILSDNLLEMGDSDRTELLLKIYDYSISLVYKLRELETSMSRMIVN